MAYDSVRRQLDQLLGVDRNELHPRREPSESLRYDDPRVCKEFLLGLCLASLPDKRRATEGRCDRAHSEQALRQFREADDRGRVRDKVIWERSLASACRAIVLEEDRRIQGIALRLKDMYGFSEPLKAIIVKDLATLQSLGLLVEGVKLTDNELPSDDDVLLENINDELAADTELAARTKSSESTHDVANPNLESNEEQSEIKILDVTSDQRTGKTPRRARDEVSSSSDREVSASDSCNSVGERHQECTNADNGVGKVRESAELPPTARPASATFDAIRHAPSEAEEPKAVIDFDAQKPGDTLGVETPSERERRETESSKPRYQLRKDGKYEGNGTGPDGLLLNREYKLRVCGQCGGLISLHDAESRLATHYSGKAHTSAVAIRNKLDELDAALASATTLQNPMDAARSGTHTGYPGSRAKRAFAEEHFARGFKRQRGAQRVDSTDVRAHSPRRPYPRERSPESDFRVNRRGGRHIGSRGERHGSEMPRRESHRYQSRDEHRGYKR